MASGNGKGEAMEVHMWAGDKSTRERRTFGKGVQEGQMVARRVIQISAGVAWLRVKAIVGVWMYVGWLRFGAAVMAQLLVYSKGAEVLFGR
jgi:hypothetical protein